MAIVIDYIFSNNYKTIGQDVVNFIQTIQNMHIVKITIGDEEVIKEIIDYIDKNNKT